MTATGVGFVQRHEQEAKEGTLYQSINAYLDRKYGKVRAIAGPGLKWLWGHEGRGCLDHPEYRIKDGLKTIVARPYGLDLGAIEELVAVAKVKNLQLFIQTPSNYNLDTLLVVLTQQEGPRWDLEK